MCVIIIQSKLLTISSEPRKLVYQKKNSESLFLISLLFLSLWYRIFFDPPVRIFISFGAVSPFPPQNKIPVVSVFFKGGMISRLWNQYCLPQHFIANYTQQARLWYRFQSRFPSRHEIRLPRFFFYFYKDVNFPL